MGKVYSMTIYQDSKRLQGTSSDFSPIASGWKFLKRVTVGAGVTSINLDVTTIPDKPYYMILHNHLNDGTAMRIGIKLNGDDGTPYSYSETRSPNGANDTTNTGGSELNVTDAANTAEDWFGVMYLANKASRNKLLISDYVGQNATGVTNVPNRVRLNGKWTKGTAAVDQITAGRVQGGGVADSGSELIILGYDPVDTEIDNFWEELASVDVTTGATISTGDFTAKKYMWVQFYLDASAISFDWKFNSSTGSEYAGRHQNNGLGASGQNTDYTQTSKTVMAENFGLNATPHFGNMFIVNNTLNEKLVMGSLVNQNTAGAGNIPNRSEFAYKWTNTSAQINNITMLNSTSVSRFVMKVWGHD
jgi:hypothetical protein